MALDFKGYSEFHVFGEICDYDGELKEIRVAKIELSDRSNFPTSIARFYCNKDSIVEAGKNDPPFSDSAINTNYVVTSDGLIFKKSLGLDGGSNKRPILVGLEL